MMNTALRGKPDAGNPHVRFDEGEVAPENPRRGSLLYKRAMMVGGVVAVASALQAAVGFKVEMNHANAMYRLGEAAVLTVSATNAPGVLAREGQIEWRLDNFTDTGIIEKGVWDFAKENPKTFRGTLTKPDFMRLYLTGDSISSLSRWNKSQFWWGVAFEPEKIQPGGPNPADFDEFWAKAIAKLEREVPLDPRVTKVTERCTKEYDFYRISFATVGGKRVYGFMSVPTDRTKAPYPVLFGVSSAGQGKWTMDMDRGLPDRIRVYFTAHNFEPPATVEALQPMHAKLAKDNFDKYGVRGYAQSGIAVSREEYYFYDKILGINRALNWVAARPDVDKTRIGYAGGSQGGGFGWYLAGLNKHISSCVLHVPALSDMLGYLGGHASGWPHLIEWLPVKDRAAAEKNLPYFDGANFARRVTCPLRVSVGFVDTACYPASVYGAFNVCPSTDKQIANGVGLGHFGQTHMLDRINDAWQLQLVAKSAAKKAVTKAFTEETGVINNPGQGWTTTAGSYKQLKDMLNIGAIYERFEWQNLEPREGGYDWRHIERILNFAAKYGIPGNTRIMCANSGTSSGGATPAWVWKKVARHYEWECFNYSNQINTNRSPHFEDADFIALHRKFMEAFAAKYDGDPRMGGIDLGSYGNWGEWHCGKLPPSVPLSVPEKYKDGKYGYHSSLKLMKDYRLTDRLGVEDMKKYVDMYLDNFKQTDIIFMTDGKEVLEYAIGTGEGSRVGMRRDGVGNTWHFTQWFDQPKSFYAKIAKMSEVWKTKPIWFESFGPYKSLQESPENSKNCEYMYYWMLKNHITLFNSFPHNPHQCKDDPQLLRLIRMINLYAGARLMPRQTTTKRDGNRFVLKLLGENKGVAKIYADYALTLVARDAKGAKLWEGDLKVDPRKWLPGAFEVDEVVELPATLAGEATFSLRLRHRPGVFKDFRFAAKELNSAGELKL